MCPSRDRSQFGPTEPASPAFMKGDYFMYNPLGTRPPKKNRIVGWVGECCCGCLLTFSYTTRAVHRAENTSHPPSDLIQGVLSHSAARV